MQIGVIESLPVEDLDRGADRAGDGLGDHKCEMEVEEMMLRLLRPREVRAHWLEKFDPRSEGDCRGELVERVRIAERSSLWDE
jgi:hypothetical protein